MSEERYYLDTDGDGHWFVIPVSKWREWDEWRDLPDDDERTWETPSFAMKVEGPSLVTFSNPCIN